MTGRTAQQEGIQRSLSQPCRSIVYTAGGDFELRCGPTMRGCAAVFTEAQWRKYDKLRLACMDWLTAGRDAPLKDWLHLVLDDSDKEGTP